MNKFLLILLTFTLVSSSIYAKRKSLIGIVQFEIKDEKVKDIASHIYKYLRSEVSKFDSKKYKVAAPPSMDLEEMYMMLACDSPDLVCMTSIGKMMKVDYLIYGTVSTQRNKYELVLKLLNVRKKKIKKGRLLGDLVNKEDMNKNIDKALRAMFGIKAKAPVIKVATRLLTVDTGGVISDVYIDGKKIGVTPLLLTTKDIKIGTYSLLITKDGYEPIKKKIVLSEDKIESISLKLSSVVIPALKKKEDKKLAVVVKKEKTLDLTQNTKPVEKQNEWYQEWWVWGVAAAVVTATVITVVLLTGEDEPGNTSKHNVVISF